VTGDEIKAAVTSRLDAEETAGIERTISDPRILASLARIVNDAARTTKPRSTDESLVM
jgi:hypothetical protein